MNELIDFINSYMAIHKKHVGTEILKEDHENEKVVGRNSAMDELSVRHIQRCFFHLPPFYDDTNIRRTCHVFGRILERARIDRRSLLPEKLKSHQYDITRIWPVGKMGYKCNILMKDLGNRIGQTAFIENDSIYLFGGMSRACSFFNDIYVFNIPKGILSKLPCTGTYPKPRAHAAVCKISNFFYMIAGGRVLSNSILSTLPYMDVFLLDSDVNRWFEAKPLNFKKPNYYPSHRAGHQIVHIAGNQFIMFGGSRDGQYFNDIWSIKLNIGYNEFNIPVYTVEYECIRESLNIPNIPVARSEHTLIALDRNVNTGVATKLLLIGGVGDNAMALDDAWIYCIDTDEWIIVKQENKIFSPSLFRDPGILLENRYLTFLTEQPLCISCTQRSNTCIFNIDDLRDKHPDFADRLPRVRCVEAVADKNTIPGGLLKGIKLDHTHVEPEIKRGLPVHLRNPINYPVVLSPNTQLFILDLKDALKQNSINWIEPIWPKISPIQHYGRVIVNYRDTLIFFGGYPFNPNFKATARPKKNDIYAVIPRISYEFNL